MVNSFSLYGGLAIDIFVLEFNGGESSHFHRRYYTSSESRFNHEASINVTFAFYLKAMPPKGYQPSDFGCCRGKKCLTGCRLRMMKTQDGSECRTLTHDGKCPCSVGHGGKRPGSGRSTSIDDAVSDQTADKKSKLTTKEATVKFEREESSSQPSSSSALLTPISAKGKQMSAGASSSSPSYKPKSLKLCTDSTPTDAEVAENPSSTSGSIGDSQAMEEDDGDDVLSDNDIDTMLLKDVPKYKKQVDEEDKPKMRTGQINFDGPIYRAHTRFLPPAFQPLVQSIGQALGTSDDQKDLLDSYMAFFLLYFKCTGAMKQEHAAAYETMEAQLNEEDSKLFATMKQAAKAMPNLDSFRHTRGKQAMKIYLMVADKNDDRSAKSFGMWLLFDFIFRYFGTYAAVEHLFWMDKAAERSLKDQLAAFYDGRSTAEDLSRYLQKRIEDVVACHTTIAAWFEKGDGRRRTFGVTDKKLERYELCSKYMDHLISAIPYWLNETVQLGTELKKVHALILGGYDVTQPFLEKFLLSMSYTTLIGKKVIESKPLGEHLCSYALKFVTGDIYYVLACLSCGKKTTDDSVAAACDCEDCEVIRQMRNNYIFMGPSPLILHATLSGHKPNGDITLDALRAFRNLLSETLGCYVDLYGVQMSPCMWRHWLRDIAKDEAMHEQTKYRMMCEAMLDVESKWILFMRDWLADVDALDIVESQPTKVKTLFFKNFKPKSGSSKDDVLYALRKYEASIQQT
jgi:hypothetical protein